MAANGAANPSRALGQLGSFQSEPGLTSRTLDDDHGITESETHEPDIQLVAIYG
jgi:hypothetical protein